MGLGDRMKANTDLAEQSLKDGTWQRYIQKAMDCRIAGEQNSKWALFYSGLTAKLPNKLHIHLMGKSQRGKSFVQSQMGNTFFANIYEDTDFSSRAFQYEAKENENTHLLDGKILQQDELADADENVRNFIKKLTTNKRETLHYRSVDKKNKPIRLDLEGMPVVWANSMEKVDEQGNQLMNRMFKMNVDESITQSKTVEQHQKNEMMFGARMDDEALFIAQKIVEYILRDGGFEVLNPFASFLEQANYAALNRLPMFHALLSAITYANRYARPLFDKDGQTFIWASFSDNLTALRIFFENEKCQRTNLPERHQKLVALLSPGLWMTKYELMRAWELKYPDEKAISAETAYQYAHDLEEQDVITSEPVEEGRGTQYGLIDFEDSSKRLLDIKSPDKKILADNVRGATLVSSSLTALGIEGVVSLLWDAEMPSNSDSQTTLDHEIN